MQRIDKLKRFSFIKYENELLQLVEIDFLDEWALFYNHQTGEYRYIGIFQYVTSVNVFINILENENISPANII